MAKIIIKKPKKQYIEELGKEVSISKKKEYYVRDTDKDFSTQYGIIKKSDLNKIGKAKSNTDKEFFIFPSQFVDDYKHIKRLPQIIPRKDIGFIITETGLGKNSVVVDSGSGSGGLCLMLANIVKKITTYDIKKEHCDIVKENAKTLGIKNITIKNKSIYIKIDETNVDVVTLDLPEPWLAVKNCITALKHGGFIINYSPSVPSVMDFISEINKHDELFHMKTIELIQREWEFEKRKVRPKSKMMGHSGFLSFVRRL
tara:strand:+ start:6229 stop:6999 length:771 start_codon:yes stop_codon:yes gene_type:complete